MSANISTETAPQGAPLTRDDREALVEIIREAHQAVCNANSAVCSARYVALQKAFDAGEALLKLKPAIRHGEWVSYLENNCELKERTAQLYMQLAANREAVEAKAQRVADLTLRGALKLISGKPAGKSDKSATSSAKPSTLSSLAWSDASPVERRHFVDSIGLLDWLAAIPPSWFPELKHRIDGQRVRVANASSDIDATIGKALRQALSLQKTAKARDNTSASVAAALNGILNKLSAAGADLNDLEVVIRAPIARAA